MKTLEETYPLLRRVRALDDTQARGLFFLLYGWHEAGLQCPDASDRIASGKFFAALERLLPRVENET